MAHIVKVLQRIFIFDNLNVISMRQSEKYYFHNHK